jgi:hypothetical protein
VKRPLAILLWIASICFVGTVHAQQQIDAQFGISGMNAPSATTFDFNDFDHNPQSLTGGVYPSFAADFILWRDFGFNGEVAWRATRATYPDPDLTPYRPIFYDFNAVFVHKTGRVGFVGMGGIGAESVRFYPQVACDSSFQQCFVSSNHLLGHVGGALRFYVTKSVYLAPEAHVYFVHNNVEFTAARATRYGLNIGYTFGR